MNELTEMMDIILLLHNYCLTQTTVPGSDVADRGVPELLHTACPTGGGVERRKLWTVLILVMCRC